MYCTSSGAPLRQLQRQGVLQGVALIKRGFPHRIGYADVHRRYAPLLQRLGDSGQPHLAKLAALPPRATLSADLTAAVECSRVEGNAAFKAQRWTDAIAAYAGALAHFDAARAEVWPSWDERDDGDDGDELGGSSLWDAASAATERSLLCNLAAAHLKLGDAATALVFADRAVHADPSFAKAHYRRRVALQTLGRESLFSLESMTEYLSNILIF